MGGIYNPQIAATVPFTPAGTIAAINTQAAVEEVNTEKVAKAGDTMTGSLIVNAPLLQMSATQGQLAIGNIGSGPEAMVFIRATSRSVANWASGDAALFATYTFSNVIDTSGLSTAGNRISNSFGGFTLSTPSVPITVTNAMGLSVGAIVAGTNVTITNNYGLVVSAGMTRLTSNLGIGANAPTTLFDLNGNYSSAIASSTGGVYFQVRAATLTDTASAAGAVANRAASSFGIPSLAATNVITIATAATVSILGAPTAGANVTITNGYALNVVGGDVQIAANLKSAGNIVVSTARHILLRSYTVATLPAVGTAELIYVSNGTGNKRLAVSDGTNWRFPDGAIVT